MRALKFSTLAELEAAHADARTAANRSQLRKRARELAAANGEAVPPWAMQPVSPLAAMPEVLKNWRAGNTGREISTDRFGAVVLSETARFERREAAFGSVDSAATAVMGRSISWQYPRRR